MVRAREGSAMDSPRSPREASTPASPEVNAARRADAHASQRLLLGLFAGASTGVFWGVPFLAPQVLKGYSPFEIAFGRFFFFGMAGLAFLKRGLVIMKALSPSDRARIVVLSATGFWLYSTVLFWSIQKTNGVLSSLVVGLLPVTIPLCSKGRKSGGWLFYSGLLSIGAGLVVLVLVPHRDAFQSLEQKSALGAAGLFACLAMWTGYAIESARFLRARSEISSLDFSNVMGLLSFACLLPLFLVSVDARSFAQRPGFTEFVALSAVLGIGSSWLANWLWNAAAKRLRSEVLGPLMVFETTFGLLYSFMHERRWPFGFEVVSIALCIVGVVVAVTAELQPKNALEPG